MSTRASGTFDVSIIPQEVQEECPGVARMLLDKRFHGDLDAVSAGQMLASSSAENGSAVYVAIESVDGTLHGRRGTFVLHHAGTSTGGGQQLSVTVAPDSGTGELVGLAGTMTITAEDEHAYDFDYTLPE